MEILLPIWVYHSLPWAEHYTHNGHGVNQRLTIPYHPPVLGLDLPRATFTNCYHRRHTTHNGTRHHVAGGWVGQSSNCRYGGEPWHGLRKDRHGGGRYRKEKNLLSGRHATEPYGGKTGGAMIKYPHTKKNAQARFNPFYQISKYISVCTITSSP